MALPPQHPLQGAGVSVRHIFKANVLFIVRDVVIHQRGRILPIPLAAVYILDDHEGQHQVHGEADKEQ